MAPSTGPQALGGHRPRASATKPIVPAIPLPMMQKRKPANVSKSAATVDGEKAKPKTSEVVTGPAPQEREKEQDNAIDVTGNTQTATSAFVQHSVPASVSTPTRSVATTPQPLSPATALPPTSPHVPEQVSAATEQTDNVSSVASTATQGPVEEQTASVPALDETSIAEEMHKEHNQSLPVLITSETQSSSSRSTYNMPPPFIPAGSAYPIADSSKAHRHVQLNASAQPASSNSGTLSFAPNDSNDSSPAPQAAGNMAYQLNETGRAQPSSLGNGQHVHHPSNGFSPMGPPPLPATFSRLDVYNGFNGHPENFARRQILPYGPVDNYPVATGPLTNDGQRLPYEVMTAHSFHGSQSSVPNEQDFSAHGMTNPYATSNSNGFNGQNGHAEDVRLYQPPRPKQRTASQGVQGHHHHQSSFASPNPYSDRDNLDGLIGYLQAQFGNPQFADYTLELRYSDDRATPVRLPGHNLLFARSPTLKDLMTAQIQESGGNALELRTVFIQSNDRFLRSDAFQMAVQRLYGAPLLHPGVVQSIQAPTMIGNHVPGTPTERFELALGYAAAGHLLRMGPVVLRGIEVAAQFISWPTLERAYDFALEGGLDQFWTQDQSQHAPRPKYGPDVQGLLHAALNFTIMNFPPNFELNTAVTQPEHHRRLPGIPETKHLAKTRYSGLQFGAFEREDEAEVPLPVVTNPSAPGSILSKLLINLPFPLLKHVLESSRLGNVSGWATAALRTKVMHAVVEEREKRRLRVLDSAIDAGTREANRKEWLPVGWRESVGTMTQQGGESSFLTRDWVGYLST